jgi:hypothetical protein
MSQSNITNRVGGYFPLIEKVVRKGFESLHRLYSDTAEVHSRRTQSNLRHDHMIRAGVELFPKRHFRLVRVGNRDMFLCRGILLQLKKFDRRVMTSNYPTSQADLFDQFGEIENALPGLCEPIPLISAGYVAREGHGLEGIFITQIVNHRPAWVIRLDEEDEQQQPIISILSPNDPISPTPSRIRRTSRRIPPAAGSTES